jgi:6-phosphogluconolactonase
VIEVAEHTYPDRDTLMRSLAELVGDQLRAAHASNGRATLAVPGGATPGPFLQALSEAELAWEDITVMLTDEREVDATHPRSNARLLHETLLRNEAAAATFIDFHGSLDRARSRVARALPIDILVIGMGADLHTASLFPGAPGLAEALSEDAPVLAELAPPGEPERRISLSAPVLRGADVVHVLITGPEKAQALRTALAGGPVEEAPIRAVLTAPCPVSVHYAD